MRVTTEKGIFTIFGEITYTHYKNATKGTLHLKTSAPFVDQKGVTRNGTYTWVIKISNSDTAIVNPTTGYKNVKYAAVEATPFDDYENFWHHPNGQARDKLRLRCLFANKSPEHLHEECNNHNLVQYFPKGDGYTVWWREDDYPDNHPLVTGVYDPYLAGEYDDFMEGGFQDDMRDDMEFFYEDERWSRD